MNKNLSKISFWLLLLNGFAFVAVAMTAFLMPLKLAEVAGYFLQKGVGTSEFLANYGGLYLMLGAVMLLSLIRQSLQAQGLLLLAVVCGGLFIGRMVAVAQFGMPAWTSILFALWELVSALLAIIFFVKQVKSSESVH